MSVSPVTRLDKLTSLRFFAALLVVLFHLRTNLPRQPGPILHLYMQFSAYGFMGVSVFYVLSGFVISLANDKWRGWRIYLLGRVARIYPSHWIVTFALVLAWAIMRYHLYLVSSWQVDLANLTLLHAWVPIPDYYLSINAVSWSLSVEMFFYVAFLFLRRLSDQHIFIAGIAAYLILAGMVLGLHGLADPYWSFYINPLARLPEFLAGMALYRLYKGNRLSMLSGPNVDFLFWLVSMLAITVYLGHRGVDTVFFYSLVPLPFCVLMMVSLLRDGSNGYMTNKILVLLGESSFALYLIHHPVIDFMNLVARHRLGLNWLLVNLLSLLLCIGLSVAFYRLIESRLTRGIKRLFVSWHDISGKRPATIESE
jgi:peptidoglycan/LPS O-acetylase OafA/YrhL